MKAIEVQGVSKAYGDVVALSDVSFSVEPGEVIGLLGPNGAGKTTLMKILTGYMQADAGEALVGGIDVGIDPLSVQARIGYLPENAPVYRDMTVQEYLLMLAQLRSLPADEVRDRLVEAIEATGLEGMVHRRIGNLSKGYRQRVGLAQALVHRPELLILDEPTTGLDPTQIVEIRDLIKELSEHSTVILSTHILPEVEMTCERVIMIMSGEVHRDAQIADLRAVNSAVVTVDAAVAENNVKQALIAIDGVEQVAVDDSEAAESGWTRWRVVSTDDDELCPAIHDVVRKHDWRIAELRTESRSLEAVFREMAAAAGEEVGL